jgi:hypothetical protein
MRFMSQPSQLSSTGVEQKEFFEALQTRATAVFSKEKRALHKTWSFFETFPSNKCLTV